MAARSPYDVLGVAPGANDDEIRAAFRTLAKRYHPDRNPGDLQAETRFKEINTAYGILGDADRRRRFDRGEIDADGNERAPAGFGGGYRRGAKAGGFGQADVDEILSSIFGTARGARAAGEFGFGRGFSSAGSPNTSKTSGRSGDQPGEDRADSEPTVQVEVPLPKAVLGTSVRVLTPDGRTLDVKIPPGTADGAKLRLRGQARSPTASGAAGPERDLLVEIKIPPHPVFRRDGDDIHSSVAISLGEAVLGGRIPVATVDGTVAMTIPAGSNSGTVLRLRGKGIPRPDGGRGDHHVSVLITLPRTADDELVTFVKRWSQDRPYDPRDPSI